MTDESRAGLTRPSLLRRIRDSGDAEAWKTFVVTYAPLIANYCRSRGLQAADADDVTQEVFSKVGRAMNGFQYDPARGRFRDWLGVVTHRELCRHMNRAKRGARATGGEEIPIDSLPDESPGTDWNDQFHAYVLATALEQIRTHFEPHTWSAFECVWLHNRSAAEVGAELKLPLETIYIAKSRVLKRLREKVLELADEIPTAATTR